jgi:RNA polymerase sigma-70 factor (ECF subfamily)
MSISLPAITVPHDRELLSRISVGDRSALSELYVGYYPLLARFLSRCLQRDFMDDVINDTFMVVWRKSKDFDDASPVSTWIMGIAYRTALNQRHRRQLGATCMFLDRRTERCVDSTRGAETRDWLDRAFARLPRKQQLVLQLVYCMSYSLEEIATIAAVPAGIVEARLFRARRRLGRLLPVRGHDIGR